MELLNGESDLLTFSSLSSQFRYFLEQAFINPITVKIDRFEFTQSPQIILVIYRLGRQKLNQKLELIDFQKKYFSYLSGYDRQRVTKFSVLQDLLANLTLEKKDTLAVSHYIIKVIKHDQLF